MKNNQVEIGKVYAVKVSGQISPVKIESESIYGGWNGRNQNTKREVRIRTAAKLRYEIGAREKTPNEILQIAQSRTPQQQKEQLRKLSLGKTLTLVDHSMESELHLIRMRDYSQ